jgi:ribonuclease Z
VELGPGDVLERGDHEIRAFAVAHGGDSLGYALVEPVRPGRFDVETADALGVPAGKQRGALQRGDVVTLPSGETVRPEQVLGSARPGRSVVLTGDTAPTASVIDAATGADLLVHEATFCEDERERARETQHSTALEAAGVARAAEVELLALTHLSNRYFGGEVVREARTIFPNTVVPRDFDTIDVRFAERGGPQLEKGGALTRRGEREAVSSGEETQE